MCCSRSVRVPKRRVEGDARRAHGMDHFVAAFDGGEDVVPFAFDIGAVGVQLGFEAGFGEHALAGGYFFGYGSPDADGDDAEIGDDFHVPSLASCMRLWRGMTGWRRGFVRLAALLC